MRSTSTASGPSAGTPTRATICPTTTTTRKGPNSPPSGRRLTSCPASSSYSTSCTGRAWSNSAWRTAPRHGVVFKRRRLERPPDTSAPLQPLMWPTMHVISVTAIYGILIQQTHTHTHTHTSRFNFTWGCHRLITAHLFRYMVVFSAAQLGLFMLLCGFHCSPLHGCWPELL